MEFFKRLWKAAKAIIEASYDFIVGPFKSIAESEHGESITVSVIGAFVRFIFAMSLMVTLPSVLVGFAVWWLTWSFRFRVFCLVLDLLLIAIGKDESAIEKAEGIMADLKAA